MPNPNDFPGLQDARKQAEQAATVLRSAIDRLHPPREGESLEDLSLRLRGAAVLAHTAGLELAHAAGFHGAASAAEPRRESDR
jgi:hypothetical protein